VKRVVLLLLGAAVVGVAAGLIVLATRGDETGASRAPRRDVVGSFQGQRRTMTISTSIEPRTHLFGDPIVARVDLLFGRDRVDPDPKKIRIDAIFRPYTQLGSPTVERHDEGDLVHLRYVYRLTCLERPCTAGGAQTEIQLPPVRVDYSLRDIRQRANDSAEWPPVTVASRLARFDVQQARWRANLDLPGVSYAIAPGTLAVLLGSGALLALLAAGALGAWLVATTRRRAVVDEALVDPGAPPLERALALVRRTFDEGDGPDRRRALERLSRELGRAEQPELAERARRLAWSSEPPSPGAVDALADDVATTNGSGPS
jgi:hypothetical protein